MSTAPPPFVVGYGQYNPFKQEVSRFESLEQGQSPRTTDRDLARIKHLLDHNVNMSWSQAVKQCCTFFFLLSLKKAILSIFGAVPGTY